MATVNEAYEVLSDPELRARFDNGDDPNDPSGGVGPGGGGGNPFAHFFQQSGGGGPFGFQGGGTVASRVAASSSISAVLLLSLYISPFRPFVSDILIARYPYHTRIALRAKAGLDRRTWEEC